MAKQWGVKIKNHIADMMLTNLAEYYDTSRDDVVEILVRLMHRIQFGSRMYPELDLNYEGYNDTLVALIMEEASNGGKDIAKVKKRVEEISRQPVVRKAINAVQSTYFTVDEDLAEQAKEIVDNDGWRVGLRKKKG